MTIPGAVRTLPDGEKAEKRTSLTEKRGWFGLVPEPDDTDVLDAGEGVRIVVDADRMVVAVSSDRGPVTDSVLFYALRSVRFT